MPNKIDKAIAEFNKQENKIKASTHKITPFNVHTTDPPSNVLWNDPETFEEELNNYNESIKILFPSWLRVWFTKGKAQTFDLHSKIYDIVLSDEFIENNGIERFKALRSGAEYDAKKGKWIVYGAKEAVDTIESRLTKILVSWNVYNSSSVSNARVYIIRKILDESFGNQNPFTLSNPALVVFTNGTYNFDTNLMQANNPHDYIMNSHDYAVNPRNCKAPETDKWLKIMFADADTLFKEFVGYMFYRSYAPFNKAMFLHGTGGNGKSVLINHILNGVIGNGNYSTVPPEELSGNNNRFKTAQLYGKELNSVADIKGGYLENTAILKKLTGGDPMDVEYKGIQGFNMVSYAKMLFSANDLPTFSDLSDGFQDRLIVVPLVNGDTRNNLSFWDQLDMKAINDEIPVFAMECIQLFRLARKRKAFSITENVKRESADWIASNDHFGEFVKENITIDATTENGERAVDVTSEYKYFCQQNNYIDKTTSQTINKKLAKYGVQAERSRKGWGADNKNTTRLIGVKLTTTIIRDAITS